jgi:hypothetical protein
MNLIIFDKHDWLKRIAGPYELTKLSIQDMMFTNRKMMYATINSSSFHDLENMDFYGKYNFRISGYHCLYLTKAIISSLHLMDELNGTYTYEIGLLCDELKIVGNLNNKVHWKQLGF